jgi:hypothetical protein
MLVNNRNYTVADEEARKYGVHEIVLKSRGAVEDPFGLDVFVTFVPPGGESWEVRVRAFFDGSNIWRARMYVTETGVWRWNSFSLQETSLHGCSGQFRCAESSLRGMLRKHPDNPLQWMTEDGNGFLNVNDTAYRLFDQETDMWKEYAAEDWNLGITSVRAGALGSIVWEDGSVDEINLSKFQTTDFRLRWLLDHLPGLYIQMILFRIITYGRDDTGEAWARRPRDERIRTMDYMIARWAAFPQLFWLVVNDIHCDESYPANRRFVREIGQHFARHDPFGHLLSAGPKRGQRFPFTEPGQDDWVSYVHIEDKYDLEAAQLKLYSSLPMHIFLGEDRYEQDRATLDPLHPAYYFRRLFWSWLLSGGSASYGGRWTVLQPYSRTGGISYTTRWVGTRDEITYSHRLSGLDSIGVIRRFFTSRDVDLALFQPCTVEDAVSEPASVNGSVHGMHRDKREYVVYHPNAAAAGRDADLDHSGPARIRINGLPDGEYRVDWVRAFDGEIKLGETVAGRQTRILTAPWVGEDVIAHIVAI